MGKNTSISLGNHFESFINVAISSSRYNSVSEVIRTDLRLLETDEQKTKKLIDAIEIGENSVIIENFDSKQRLIYLLRKHL